jgi:hypothetical protein
VVVDEGAQTVDVGGAEDGRRAERWWTGVGVLDLEADADAIGVQNEARHARARVTLAAARARRAQRLRSFRNCWSEWATNSCSEPAFPRRHRHEVAPRCSGTR